MCEGGRLIASFTTGTTERPAVPEVVEPSLTRTDDGAWLIWAYKVARPVGDLFRPVTGGDPYPADAVAQCLLRFAHKPPDPNCTCGFHAVSDPLGYPIGGTFQPLEVALTGAILAFEWGNGGLLFRAERQTVMRVGAPLRRTAAMRFPADRPDPPPEPSGRTARLRPPSPRDPNQSHLTLPTAPPPLVRLTDDPGHCVLPQAMTLHSTQRDDTSTAAPRSLTALR
ncbi:hypothetical protein [Nocardia crassostreae]|uniref:hypothetical protein n=1 Tax=Nocardia crassostreae TaxID=53428 RepID=UPI00082F0995|nr:hypothetical protein [Nocardia crassostreae]